MFEGFRRQIDTGNARAGPEPLNEVRARTKPDFQDFLAVVAGELPRRNE